MHILLVTYEFPPAMATGGIGSYMHHLANLFFSYGYKVSVISATTGKSEFVVDREFCTNYLIPASDPESFRLLALNVFERYLKHSEIDLMESPEVGACALEIKIKYPGIPLVVKMHTPGVLITKISNVNQSLITKIRYVAGALIRGRLDFGYWSKYDRNKETNPEYIICNRANLLLSPSEALKQWAVTYWKLSKERIEVLPNPFVLHAESLKFPVERTTKTICFLGKLTVLKGMLSFTPAIRLLLEKYTEYRVVIIGRDEAVSPVIPSMKEWMIQQLGAVADRIRFTGPLIADDVKVELGNSDIVIVPSLWENYPTVLLEAMAAGCAVAASDRGGIPEIITDRVNGILFNPLKVQAIVKAIDMLINDPILRVTLAAKGRQTVLDKNNHSFIQAVEQRYRSFAATYSQNAYHSFS